MQDKLKTFSQTEHIYIGEMPCKRRLPLLKIIILGNWLRYHQERKLSNQSGSIQDKYKTLEEVERYKARLFANGFTQV